MCLLVIMEWGNMMPHVLNVFVSMVYLDDIYMLISYNSFLVIV
jgi:hypothetical protein